MAQSASLSRKRSPVQIRSPAPYQHYSTNTHTTILALEKMMQDSVYVSELEQKLTLLEAIKSEEALIV